MYQNALLNMFHSFPGSGIVSASSADELGCIIVFDFSAILLCVQDQLVASQHLHVQDASLANRLSQTSYTLLTEMGLGEISGWLGQHMQKLSF